ncbi:MAG: glycosyltransferase family 2 protein [Burkholderiales bacterium]
MLDSSASAEMQTQRELDLARRPAVSIILPTYNRAKFLPAAFAAIQGQQWTDWELIVIDDGSTDETQELVPELTRGWQQPLRYIYQENQGAYGARNTGLDHARGNYIAFYDSDDIWLPHHLKDCAAALEANADLDWVYGACQIVEQATGGVLAHSTFYLEGQPRPFIKLATRDIGALRIIDDSAATQCMILHGLYCGLQNSVIRSALFENYRFEACNRNEAEDQLIVIDMLARGCRLGYLDSVHVVYQLHSDNSTGASSSISLERRLSVHLALVQGFETLRKRLRLRPADRRALNHRLSQEYFWHLGYALYWSHGRHCEALQMFRKGIALRPWHWSYWKTYLAARLSQAWKQP